MRCWLERCVHCIFAVFRIGSLLTLLLLTRSQCIIIIFLGYPYLLRLPRAGITSCRRSLRVIQLACSTLVGRVQLIMDDPTAWLMTPAIALMLMPKCPTILAPAPGVSNVPPTFFTPWTTAIFPFSRLMRMMPLGLL